MGFAIIGNGVAGNTAALALSRIAAGIPIDLYAAEPHPYYPRPLLPEFIAGEMDRERLYFKPASWYAERGITLHLGRTVTGLEPKEHRLRLADGEIASYDRLLVATGGHAWIPPIEGAGKPGVFSLRTLEDALAIAERACLARRAIVIGCGLLGLETGRALQALGLGVSMIEFMPRLLPRQLDAEGAEVLQRLIEGPEVRLVLNAAAETVLGTGEAEGLRLKDGREFEADLILVSAGMRSNTELAQLAGLEINRGVAVDRHMRTSAKDVYAAGDVAGFEGRVYGIVPAAIAQARVAAANMAGNESVTYAGTLPSTTLKVTGIDLTSLGTIVPEDGREGEYRELRYSDLDRGVYRKLVLKGGSIVGAILLGDKASVQPVTKLIDQEVDVSEHADSLLDLGFDLSGLLHQT
ncbi:MAG TPA: FAD-dependent oxidoreductase [Anaerolineae bacterium]|nr:FAD-dependent oxidoreductase [Anaerolineae bacterium]